MACNGAHRNLGAVATYSKVCNVIGRKRSGVALTTDISLRPYRFLLTSRASYATSAAASGANLYQYMQHSKLPTLHFQHSLPRLPIPKLEHTTARFLAAVQPLLTPDEYALTQKSLQEFSFGEGQQLNELLKQSDAANKATSYISAPWFDMYLTDRAPLPLNYNPLLVMKSDPRAEYQNQIVRAANLVISSLRFWSSLRAGLLEPEVYHMNPKKSDTAQFRQWTRLAPELIATYVAYAFKAFPLDMSQYHRLFGTSRVPTLHKDRLVHSPESRHILVMRRGHMYAVDVLNVNGKIELPLVICSRLQAVQKLDSQRQPADLPLGVLTTGERNEWARTRDHLATGISASNQQLLQSEIDAALFCLCLDDADEPSYDKKQPEPLLKHLLAGNAKNRWFDKSVSLIVGADGTAAINFEHSWGDGVAVMRYFNDIHKETTERPYVTHDMLAVTTSDDCNAVGVRAIQLQLDDKVHRDVSLAIEKNATQQKSLRMHMLRYPHLNKVSCKRDKVSPDAIMQLAFQLAYRQAFNKYVGTYESCSTAAFRHGRTETMRPCTMRTKQFCESVLQPAKTGGRASTNELRDLVDRCSSAHGQLTKEAAMGQGFDRHLFALKHTAIVNNLPIPEFYSTKAYRKINYNIISTSTLSSNALLAGSFGPVVSDGLGIGYSIQNEECGAIVTSYENQANGKLFIDSLEQAFEEIRKVLSASKK